jgi:tripartite-type tricarboxylate transporter receptor subunit TctC
MEHHRFATTITCSAIFGLAVCLTAVDPAGAQDISFKGKIVHVLIGSKPGGGTSGTSRLVGRMIAKYLPGTPKIIFQNMPGGGGIKATNYFYNVTKPDGMTLFGQARSKLSPLTLKRRSVKYDTRKLNFIGATGNLGSVVLIRKKVRSRLTDKSAKPVVYGAKDSYRTGIQATLWAKAYLGWNVKWVMGYQGTPAVVMAARRTEIDMMGNNNIGTVNPLIKKGTMVALAQIGVPGDGGKMVARSSFPNVPVISDMVGPKLDAKARRAFDGWLNDFLVGKWFALPPKTSAKMVKVYRTAFKKMSKDPEFIKRGKKLFGKDFAMLSGEAVGHIARRLANTSAADLNFFTELGKKHKLPVD